MANPEKLLYVFESGPYSSAAGVEALDALMVGASFEQNISVLFMFDGVFQLKRGQDSADLLIKEYTRAFKALNDFDVTQIYVHDQSLAARGLTLTDLMIDCHLVDGEQIALLLAEQRNVFTF